MADQVHQLMHEMPPQGWFLLLFPLFLLLVHYRLNNKRAINNQQPDHRLPPSPPALPILGHLHLVGSLPHVSLRGLARKHGPDLMLLRLGAVPTLVVSSPRAAEAVLRTHDHVFASRPRSVITDIILHGSCDVGFAPYGENWRLARKLITTHLLSVKKVQSFRSAREEEDVFFGAIDTAAQVLEFTIAELMLRPHLMMKLQAEVRSRIPEEQEIVSEVNLNNMTYLRAVIKEALRLHPVAPLLAPHLSMTNCNIDGYMIPAGLRVFVNTWAICRDRRFWEDAEEFMPERFLDDGSAACVDFKGNDFQYLPFGAGRRMCPGMNLGMATVEVMLANLMHRFDWELPPGMKIDMSEVFGLTVHRKEKLLLVPKLHV